MGIPERSPSGTRSLPDVLRCLYQTPAPGRLAGAQIVPNPYSTVHPGCEHSNPSLSPDVSAVTLVVSALRGPGARAGSGGKLGQTSELQVSTVLRWLPAVLCESVQLSA